ncbi:MAG: S-layer homology domain-containing protein [Desulfocucumaceae bacterium]
MGPNTAFYRIFSGLFAVLLLLAFCPAITPVFAQEPLPQLTVPPDLGGQPWTDLEVPVLLTGDGSVAGVQFDFIYDQGLLEFTGTAAGDLTEGYQIVHKKILDNKIRVIIANIGGDLIPQGTGSVARLLFRVLDCAPPGGECGLELENVILAGEGGEEIGPAAVSNGHFKVVPLELSVSAAQGCPGTQAIASVSLFSQGQVYGLQYDINYDTALLEYKDVLSGELGPDYTVAHNEASPGTVHVMVVRIDGVPIPTGTIAVSELKFELKGGAQAGSTCPLNLSKVILSTKEEGNVSIDLFSVKNSLFTVGDAVNLNASPDSVELSVGATSQISATASPQEATISYASGNTSVATIDASGKIAAVGAGSTFVTVSASIEGYCSTSDRIAVTVSGGSGSNGGGGGGGGNGYYTLDVDRLEPTGNQKDVHIDAAVRVTFRQEIKAEDLSAICIKDREGKKQSGIKASVSGKTLTLEHESFKYATPYSVEIPAGSVARNDGLAKNSLIRWEFTTIKEPVVNRQLPDNCSFQDVPSSHWAAEIIGELCTKGIVRGYPDGLFRPEGKITRAEFTCIISHVMKIYGNYTGAPAFKDVLEGQWHYSCVQPAADDGLVKGYGNSLFLPDNNISRQEMAAVLVQAMGMSGRAMSGSGGRTNFGDDGEIAPWARGAVAVAVQEGLVAGYPDNTIRPDDFATRAEACAMIYHFMEKLGQD